MCVILFTHLFALTFDALPQTATAFWTVLLAPQYPIVTDIVEFVNVCGYGSGVSTGADIAFKEKANYKGINKDVWSMVSSP